MRALLVALLLAVFALPVAAQSGLTIVPYMFTAEDGRTAEAELGRFRVPENRTRPDGRTIELAFVRFPSTNPTPGAPIVYLAGGPGGSGTNAAMGSRFDLFQSLRSVADVIAFDQRGTGLSEQLPDCPHDVAIPLDVTGRAAAEAAIRPVVEACADHWRRVGVDLTAYTTEESADDLDALRRALGADQVSLWAISYGSHLALSTIRRHPDTIASAVLAGTEGPDDTYKLPSDQQEILRRIDVRHAAETPGAPSFLADVETVLTRLREAPVTVESTVDGDTQTVAIGAFEVQWLASNMLFGPRFSMQLPQLFADMRDGDFSGTAGWIRFLKAPEGLNAMSMAMDVASGASVLRRAQIRSEARQTLLGDAINFPNGLYAEVMRLPDLGPAFRAPITSDVPTLFISGTLDGRTAPANAEAARTGFSRQGHLVIEGAGHSDPLFLGSPIILERMLALFERGVAVDETISMAE